MEHLLRRVICVHHHAATMSTGDSIKPPVDTPGEGLDGVRDGTVWYTCLICFDELPYSPGRDDNIGFQLPACGHIYCRNCLISFLRSEIGEARIAPSCFNNTPAPTGGSNGREETGAVCGAQIPHEVIRELLVGSHEPYADTYVHPSMVPRLKKRLRNGGKEGRERSISAALRAWDDAGEADSAWLSDTDANGFRNSNSSITSSAAARSSTVSLPIPIPNPNPNSSSNSPTHALCAELDPDLPRSSRGRGRVEDPGPGLEPEPEQWGGLGFLSSNKSESGSASKDRDGDGGSGSDSDSRRSGDPSLASSDSPDPGPGPLSDAALDAETRNLLLFQRYERFKFFADHKAGRECPRCSHRQVHPAALALTLTLADTGVDPKGDRVKAETGTGINPPVEVSTHVDVLFPPPVCSKAHPCEFVPPRSLPSTYPTGSSIYCSSCGRRALERLSGGFYHCSECEYDVCTDCASASAGGLGVAAMQTAGFCCGYIPIPALETATAAGAETSTSTSAAAAAGAVQQGMTDEQNMMTCEHCDTHYCFTHGGAHLARTCSEYTASIAGEVRATEEVVSSISKPCPGCGLAIEKTGGCNHMQCNQCQTAFCWVCGKQIDDDTFPAHFQWWNPAGCTNMQVT